MPTVDDDGFVCLVCPDRYIGYVDEDWTLEQVLERFVQQMNAGTLFVAYPGPDWTDEPFAVVAEPSAQAAAREATGGIRVGEGGVWLTDYIQLTMAAQYADSAPVATHHTRLPIGPGAYRVTLRELSEGAAPALELVVASG
ncbi:MAG: hypothetical protein J2P38_11255, partial [Candidatus Dormibacteraeota bacterium]|nr:hypothetical protein [Candidatus Dormibacteraeota bacterium]